VNCAHAERLLYLHRPGERTDMEDRQLEDHLRQCAACRAIARRVGALEGATMRLRRVEPVLEDPEAFTRAVMRAVTVSGPGRQSIVLTLLERLSAWSNPPSVRLACASVVILAFLGLSYEGIDVAASLSSLEARMSSTRGHADLVQVAWSVPVEPLKAVVGNTAGWAELSRFIPGMNNESVTVTSRMLRAVGEIAGGVPGIDRQTTRAILRAAEEHAQRTIQFAREGA